jgi:hypothetical protein
MNSQNTYGGYVPGKWELLHPATSPNVLYLVPSINLRNAHLTLLSGESEVLGIGNSC